MSQPSQIDQTNRLKRALKHYGKWIALASLVGILCGVASAVFLKALEAATEYRESHAWLLFLLPLPGLVVGAAYHSLGRSVEGGNNLLIDEFHAPKAVIPLRMAPLVLFGTILTHLFGGSAGREGTAVQMGGSLADQLTHLFNMRRSERRTLLMAGMAGGFGSVFGVPFAGTMFGLEVLAVGRLHLWALVECATAAFVANYVTLALGVHHTPYAHPAVTAAFTGSNAVFAVVCGLVFGLAARLFALVTETVAGVSKRRLSYLPLRSLVGGCILSLLYLFAPLFQRYAGLGIGIIVDAIKGPVPPYDWFGKLTFTALTLGMGFKGGEVTPLLFIGATLGNALSLIVPLPLPILAAMGFVGVFAGAANTPFACTIMAMELFGTDIGLLAGLACFASYAASGHHGIYKHQRVDVKKYAYVSHTKELLSLLFTRPPLS